MLPAAHQQPARPLARPLPHRLAQAMTAAPASPQQIRDRLLQAIDPQSNIRNMVAVLEVISSLEKYPITKEALEETRLGKLINDVRKKTTNEELAKRAKKLLRSWQKLIEPAHQNEAALRGLAGAAGSANGGAHHCRPEAGPPGTPKSIQELKSRNDIQRLPGQRPDRLGGQKRRGDQRDLGHPGPPAKVSKASHEPLLPNSSPLPTNGISGSPESFPGPPDGGGGGGGGGGGHGPESGRVEPTENDTHSGKIPVHAVRPHTSSPGLGQPPGPCLQTKAAVLQQLDRVDETPGPPHPRGPARCSFSPRNSRHEGSFARQRSPYAPKGSVSSPSPRLQPLDATQVPSPLPLAQPSTPPVRRLELLPSAESPVRWLEQPEGRHRLAAPGCKAGLPPAGFSPDSSRVDSDAAAAGGSDSKKKKRYRPRDYTVNLDGQVAEAGVRPVRLKERKLTFDPMTRQIKPLTQKEPVRADSPARTEQPPRTEPDAPEAKASLQSPFEQTNWKELSGNEIIQSYLSRQSSLLLSSGTQTPGAHHFMSKYLKQEQSRAHSHLAAGGSGGGGQEPRGLPPLPPSRDSPPFVKCCYQFTNKIAKGGRRARTAKRVRNLSERVSPHPGTQAGRQAGAGTRPPEPEPEPGAEPRVRPLKTDAEKRRSPHHRPIPGQRAEPWDGTWGDERRMWGPGAPPRTALSARGRSPQGREAGRAPCKEKPKMSMRRCVAGSGTGTFQNTSAFIRGEPSYIVRALKPDRHARSRREHGHMPQKQTAWNAGRTKAWAAAAGRASLVSPGHPDAAALQPCASCVVLMRICLFI
uniref:Mediator of RNA polymerase II transcription subunit 26 n=1 Tax=Oryctolagus cuniculus TaxID=9986 RepID=A0A5F9DPN7_RABIT